MYPDERAFLDAVLANPDDDLPRLQFADALELGDGGIPTDPARGAFIRLQLELADALPELPVVDTDRLPRVSEGADGLFHSEGRAFGPLPALHEGAEVDLRFPGGVARGWRVYEVGAEYRFRMAYAVRSCGEPRLWSTAEAAARKLMPRARYDALRQRERALLTQQTGWGWPGMKELLPLQVTEPQPDTGGPWVAFRRGFVSRIAVPWDHWRANAEAILASCPIRGPNVGTAKKPRYEQFSKDGLVRLTTQPVIQSTGDFARYRWYRLRDCSRWRDLGPRHDREDRQRILERLLAAEWPGVRFEPPPVADIHLVEPNSGHLYPATAEFIG